MSEANKGTARVTRQDLLASGLVVEGNHDQVIMSILKEKGAPVEGTVYLTADVEHYDWSVKDEQKTGDRIYGWCKKKKVPSTKRT